MNNSFTFLLQKNFLLDFTDIYQRYYFLGKKKLLVIYRWLGLFCVFTSDNSLEHRKNRSE